MVKRLNEWTYKKGKHYSIENFDVYYVYKNGKKEKFDVSKNPKTFSTIIDAKHYIGNQKRLEYALYSADKNLPTRMEQKGLSPTKLRYKKKKTSFGFDEWK